MRTRSLVIAGALVLGTAFVAVPLLTGRSVQALVSDLVAGTRGLTETTIRQPTVAAPKGPNAPAAVTVSQPVRREIVEWDQTTGRFDAVETVDIKARLNGYLQEVLFKDGQEVAKGDTLFVIDPRPAQNALALAQAELAQARTRIANADLDVERGRPLLQRRVLSEKVFDDRENVKREAESLARIAEAKVKTAELDLSFTRVAAPIGGRIGRSLVSPGNFVGGGGLGGTTTLATIVSQDPIYAYFDITEADALKYKRLADLGQTGADTGGAGKAGARVEAALPDETGFPHAGRIDFFDNRLDSATGSLRARAVFDNKARLFAPGQFIRLRLQGSVRAPAILVPDEAIGTDQGNRFVVIVGSDDTPVRKPVKLGPLVDGLRVVREGLTTDDWIVVKGLTRIRPGQKVAPKREPLKVSEGARPVTGTASP
jgi:RND family efflux transporter MFP subunit